eukprot:2087921-Prymnesium_polylepis.2
MEAGHDAPREAEAQLRLLIVPYGVVSLQRPRVGAHAALCTPAAAAGGVPRMGALAGEHLQGLRPELSGSLRQIRWQRRLIVGVESRAAPTPCHQRSRAPAATRGSRAVAAVGSRTTPPSDPCRTRRRDGRTARRSVAQPTAASGATSSSGGCAGGPVRRPGVARGARLAAGGTGHSHTGFRRRCPTDGASS